MNDKIPIILSIIAIVCGLTSSGIFVYLLISDQEEEPKTFDIKQNVCFMPRDCYDSEKEYLEQFPNKEIPEILYECLIHCYK